MTSTLVLFIILALLILGLPIALVIWIVLSQNDFFPLRYGGFGPDNGYDQPRPMPQKKEKEKNKKIIK